LNIECSMPITPNQKSVIIIIGPTASGKTALAIDIAGHFQTEIISADSRQCYEELTIGVARPSEDELQQVKHHFIATHSIHDEVTAVAFEQYALAKTKELFNAQDVVLMVGGTGLYIKAFCEGLDTIPAIEEQTRTKIISDYEKHGMEWLENELRQKDPDFFRVGEIRNPQRMMRALEVVESTGQSILAFRNGKKAERDFNIIKIGIDIPKEELHERISRRTDQMMENGLLEEVKSLLPYKHLNALQTVGYKELFEHLDQKVSLEKAIERIKTNTRQYAKRQLTWFRKDKDISWISAPQMHSIAGKIEQDMRQLKK
jgi:tRNA dimethylallyltransferase